MTYEQLTKVGRFGCASCYDTFKEHLKPLLKRLHGGHTDHCGKIPKRIEGNIHLKKELDELKLILKQYVQKEEFEKAAGVRDKIRNLETQLSEHREGNSSMSLDKIMNEAISPWMKGDGPDSDIVLSSRIRLARNFKNINSLLCKTKKKLNRFKNYLKRNL